MNNTLIEYLQNNTHCKSFSKETTEFLLNQLGTKFNLDYDKLFIWDEESNTNVVEYMNDILQWEALLTNYLSDFQPVIFIVITDENFYPWEIFECKKDNIISILKDLPYFEYFIFDQTMKNILFDTHMNELILI